MANQPPGPHGIDYREKYIGALEELLEAQKAVSALKEEKAKEFKKAAPSSHKSGAPEEDKININT